MNSSPLEIMHDRFATALQSHQYIGSEANQLKITKTKTIRLYQVFQLAQEQINLVIKETNPLEMTKHIISLNKLDKDGKAYYDKYKAISNRWDRLFLKTLALYTPAFLKRYLPACFSNQIKEAENETEKQYKNYQSCLLKHIETITNQNVKDDEKSPFLKKSVNDGLKLPPLPPLPGKGAVDIFDIDPLDEDDDPLLQELLLSSNSPKGDGELILEDDVINALYEKNLPQENGSEKISTEKQKEHEAKIEFLTQSIKELIAFLNSFDTHPVSFKKYHAAIKLLCETTNSLLAIDPNYFLNSFGSESSILLAISNQKMIELLDSSNPADLLPSLPTTWAAFYKEALADKDSIIELKIQNLLKKKIIKLNKKEGPQVKEDPAIRFYGALHLCINSEKPESDLAELFRFFDTHQNFRPFLIKIELSTKTDYSFALSKLLSPLQKLASEVEVTNVRSINLIADRLSCLDELAFIRNLEGFTFPDLTQATLLDEPKKNWKQKDFSILLNACPLMHVLEQCYRHASHPQDIKPPKELIDQVKHLDLRSFPLEKIDYLFQQWSSSLNLHVNLTGQAVTDKQLTGWIKMGYLNSAHSLILTDCAKLTTDILNHLGELPSLSHLQLPDLPKGTIPLAKLLTYDNPLKIAQLYTASQATASLASDLYKGPVIWAPLFQIPLARKSVSQIFPAHQRFLDPKSIALWLHQSDYLYLSPQDSIIEIFADSNAALNDNNLIPFFQKFPRAKKISLSNCPAITNEGVINLLKACPQITHLDLSHCLQITEQFLSDKESTGLFKQLKVLNILNTGISDDFAQTFSRQIATKLIFEKTLLKISNEDLIDENSLEQILKNQPLNKLKRIDLSDCSRLTDQMLSKLLDRFNAPKWLTGKDGCQEENPDRIQLDVLILSNCENISDQAFHDISRTDKLNTKIIEYLSRIVKGGTKISQLMETLYPQIIFQELDAPLTIQIEPERQFVDCLTSLSMGTSDQAALPPVGKKLKQSFIHNFITSQIFKSNLRNQKELENLEAASLNFYSPEFSDFVISFAKPFSTKNGQESPSSFFVHRDLLAYQSSSFLSQMRPGGDLYKIEGLSLLNVHATPKAAKFIIDLFYGKGDPASLDIETAADAAEFIGPKNFNCPKPYYKKLLNHLHKQFDLSNARKLLLTAALLGDERGNKIYDERLVEILKLLEISGFKKYKKNQEQLQLIASLSQSFNGLPLTKAKASQLQDKATEAIVKNMHEEINENNILLTQEILAFEALI